MTPSDALVEHFEVPDSTDLPPRSNVAPSQPVAVVRPAADRAGRDAVMLRWGMIPAWADDSAIGYKMINARAETVADKPAYRSAFRERRCPFRPTRLTGGRSRGDANGPTTSPTRAAPHSPSRG